jgi:hypothetical protein
MNCLCVFRAVLVITGVASFALAKNLIDKQRYNHMKSRDRMKNSNLGMDNTFYLTNIHELTSNYIIVVIR